MNEHIRSLAEQAGLRVESWMTNPPSPFQIIGSTEQFEKFTELIINECCNLFVELRTRPADLAALDVKAYFGIKE